MTNLQRPFIGMLQIATTFAATSLSKMFENLSDLTIDAVNQGNWSLSIKLRLACFVIVE